MCVRGCERVRVRVRVLVECANGLNRTQYM